MRVNEIDRIVHRHLFHIRCDAAEPGVAAGIAVGAAILGRVPILVQRRDIIHVDIIGDRQRDLLEVVGALRPAGSLSGGLHGRQQERDQHGDDRDHDQSSISVKPRLRSL